MGWGSPQLRLLPPLPIAPPSTPEEFSAIIGLVLDRFRHFVENDRGWQLLWDGGLPKPEEAAQLLFRGIARSYCEANDINVDREVLLGRGPVDFKFSNGYRHRALLEVKKLENGKFWNGLWAQLPASLEDEQCQHGWFLAIRYQTQGVAATRVRSLPQEVAAAGKRHNLDLRYGLVDAQRPTSASKLKRTDGAKPS